MAVAAQMGTSLVRSCVLGKRGGAGREKEVDPRPVFAAGSELVYRTFIYFRCQLLTID